jgi:uncharacterized protein YecE (DUF72 family)
LDIRVGTSGFYFDDWAGTVYPIGLNKRDWLTFYERELGFRALEVNYTYYSLPSEKNLASMSRKTSEGFDFVIKAHRSMTHDIWTDNKRSEIIDNTESFKVFKGALSPLIDDGKLACVLAQFPYFFYRNRGNEDYLAKFKDRMGDIPTVIEFRNRAWHGESALDILRRNDLGYCIVDEPKIRGLMPYHPVATSDIAYFRFHGRNKNWYNAPLEVRYDYLYSEGELKDFISDILNLAETVPKTMVFFNNCHAGQAAKNAIEIAKMLLEEE